MAIIFLKSSLVPNGGSPGRTKRQRTHSRTKDKKKMSYLLFRRNLTPNLHIFFCFPLTKVSLKGAESTFDHWSLSLFLSFFLSSFFLSRLCYKEMEVDWQLNSFPLWKSAFLSANTEPSDLILQDQHEGDFFLWMWKCSLREKEVVFATQDLGWNGVWKESQVGSEDLSIYRQER